MNKAQTWLIACLRKQAQRKYQKANNAYLIPDLIEKAIRLIVQYMAAFLMSARRVCYARAQRIGGQGCEIDQLADEKETEWSK